MWPASAASKATILEGAVNSNAQLDRNFDAASLTRMSQFVEAHRCRVPVLCVRRITAAQCLAIDFTTPIVEGDSETVAGDCRRQGPVPIRSVF